MIEEPNQPSKRVAHWLNLLVIRVFQWSLGLYRKSLRWVLENPGLVLTMLALIIALNVAIAYKIPKGFFPQQDTGSLGGRCAGRRMHRTRR